MEIETIMVLATLLSMAFFSGCTSSQTAKNATTTVMTTKTLAFEEPRVVYSSKAGLNDFLADSNGMTLYIFTKDEPGKSNCYGQCAASWPPLLTEGSPLAGSDITGRLGVVERTDGTKQVSYNGMPLYYWVNDKAPGDTTGQGVGGVWFVVSVEPTNTTKLTTATTMKSEQTTTTTIPIVSGTECSSGSDCMTSSCCHPTECVKAYQRVCNMLCTNVCEGSLDCNRGQCGCVNGKCVVVTMDTNTTMPTIQSTTISKTTTTKLTPTTMYSYGYY
ncbi:MAG: hypothetical protein PHG85_06415 [Candidatus Altiarchaeota archaeon]|nr:hypothetical protein [Candidatus Altiarchaeota archaeon]